MLLLQLVALSIVILYVVSRIKEQADSRRFLARFVLVSAACWITEESCILLYNFYRYSPAWSLFLGHVPILIILIWPVIIHSAWDLASQLLRPERKLVPLAAAAIVCTDASLIEPVAVNANLWSWNEPGIFHVPPIGIFGWGSFAFLCAFLFEKGRQRNASKKRDLLLLVFPLIATHVLLLGTWWGALRWVNIPVDPTAAAGVAWALSLVLVYTILRRGTGRRMEKKTLLLRLPAAFLVFVLLALNASGSGLLVIYAVAFVPPYLTLMAQQYGGILRQ
jgi:uncharacterized membrane protein